MGIMLLLTLMMSLQIAMGDAVQVSPRVRELMDSISAEAAKLERSVADVNKSVTSQTELLGSGALLDSRILEDSIKQMNNEIESSQNELQRLHQMTAAAQQDLAETKSEIESRSAEVARISSLKQENERIQSEIEMLQSGQRVIYNAHDSESQNCWLVELSDTTDIKAAMIGQEQAFQSFPNTAALTQWIEARAKAGDAFMLLIKPNAATEFDRITQVLHRQSGPFGFDLLPQDAIVLGQQVSGGTP